MLGVGVDCYVWWFSLIGLVCCLLLFFVACCSLLVCVVRCWMWAFVVVIEYVLLLGVVVVSCVVL